MAEGILTAIQAALAGLGGGIEGAQQYRAYEQKRKRENDMMERQAAQDARQARLDEATMRNEERQAVGAQGNMVPADVFAKYTMPGATPMQSALTQQIGGKDFAFSPNIMQAEAHREAVMKERAARAKDAAEKTALGGLYENLTLGGAPIIPKGQGGALAGLPVNAQSSVIGAATRIAEAKLKTARGMDTGERALLSQAQTNARNSADEFQRTLKDRPKQKDFVNQLTRKPDTAAFAEATRQWASGDSTFAARRMADDQTELQRVKADLGVATPAPAAAQRSGSASPTAAQESQLGMQAQRKIEEIQSSDLTPEEKQQKVQQVNAILSRELLKVRGQGR